MQAVPDHAATGGEALDGFVSLGADQQIILGQQGQQLGKGGLVGRHCREDVDVVVDDGAQQHLVRVIEQELRAPVLAADDVLVALEDEGLVAAGVAGGVQVQRNCADEVAGVPARLAHQEGDQGGEAGFAEAAGDDDVLAALGVDAQVLGEAVARHAQADEFGQFGIVPQVQLGAGTDDGDVDGGGDLRRVEPHVVGDAHAGEVGADRRKDAVVRAGDGVAFRRQDRSQGADPRAGDAEEIDVHGGV